MKAQLPSTLSLRFCTTCGQTDRYKLLGDIHFSGGTLCPGKIEVGRYRLSSATPSRAQDHGKAA